MADPELAQRIREGRRFAASDEEGDWQLLEEVMKIPDPVQRLQRYNTILKAGEQLEGWQSDVLRGARVYVMHGQLPPRDFLTNPEQ